jgi:hypothetical protein
MFHLWLNENIRRALGHIKAQIAVANFVLVVLFVCFHLTVHYGSQILIQSVVDLRTFEVQHRGDLLRL